MLFAKVTDDEAVLHLTSTQLVHTEVSIIIKLPGLSRYT